MMVFNSSERVLPPIMTLEASSQISGNATTILPPVSCLAPEMSTLPNSPHDINRMPTSSSMHVPGTYIYPTSYASTPSPSSSSSFEWKFATTSASHITVNGPSQVHSQIPSQVPPQIPSQIPPQIPPSRSNDHHNLIAKPIHNQYPYQPYIDPASELLAEKRRRNAGASARFRDRRKQREREMKDKCQFLERRVQELEGMNNVKRIIELEKKLEEANEETIASQTKIRELERNVCNIYWNQLDKF